MISLLELRSDLPKLSAIEIEHYLGSGLFQGIGKRTSEILVSFFGDQTLLVLDKSPEKLNEISGLGKSRSAAIVEAWVQTKQNPSFAVIAKLVATGNSLALALKVCDHYGHLAADILTNDPYRLIDDLDGVGFQTADKLAISFGMPLDSDIRYEKGLVQTLKEALKDGHCFLPEKHLLLRCQALLEYPGYSPSDDRLHGVLNRTVEKQVLVRGSLDSSIYLRAAIRAEVSIATKIKKLISRPTKPTLALENWVRSLESLPGRELSLLSKEQVDALIMAEKHGISILTGGPGRGKTHVLRTLVEWLQLNKLSFALAAPTGKAANRMSFATNAPATTIHRLLQWKGHGQSFLYNENNPLCIDWLIIDEFSMVDIFLFNSLLKALLPRTQILLVGDKDQLPSVGAGMLLRDLLVSEMIPMTMLRKIYRQRNESPIIYAADDVNQGVVPILQRFYQASQWMDVGDCSMLEADAQTASATIVELVKAIKSENVDLNEQVIVLAPQKSGVAGVHNLNSLLHPIFNPKKDGQEIQVGSVIFRTGDRVIQLKNRYDTTPPVMNGETGRIAFVNCEKKMFQVTFEGGAQVDYNAASYDQIMHSFCITCHKSQGSEFSYVIFPILKASSHMLTRQLIYTTMTRASNTFIAVGQTAALKFAVSANKPQQRFTGLVSHLMSNFVELESLLTPLNKTGSLDIVSPQTLTVNSRLQALGLEASPGQMTAIGSLILQMYKSKYGYRPSKQFEQVGTFRFKTYHYDMSEVELMDSAIRSVLYP